jgi:hypothetical protein
MRSDYIGIPFAALGQSDHELSKTIATDLVVKTKVEAGFRESASQHIS